MYVFRTSFSLFLEAPNLHYKIVEVSIRMYFAGVTAVLPMCRGT